MSSLTPPADLIALKREFDETFGEDIDRANIPFDGAEAARDAELESGGEGCRLVMGGPRGCLPHLGEVTWAAPNAPGDRVPWRAYSFLAPDGTSMGYMRIPHYYWDGSAHEAFSEIMDRLELTTSVLIVDQQWNPGGSLATMYRAAQKLTDRPLSVPTHEMLFNDDDLLRAQQIVKRAALKNAHGAKRPSDEATRYARFVLEEVSAGRGWKGTLSKPGYILGISRVDPADVSYSGRLYLLVNETTFSAAEFLAAMMQDDKRAKLVGIRTAGAGGCARRHFRQPVYSRESGELILEAFSFTLTWTIASRKNGQYIENLGVTPDLAFSTTQEDIATGYQTYPPRLMDLIIQDGHTNTS